MSLRSHFDASIANDRLAQTTGMRAHAFERSGPAIERAKGVAPAARIWQESTMLASLLALGASFGWGVSDFLGGLKGRSSPVLAILLVSQATALAVLAAFVAVIGEGPPATQYIVLAAAAGLGETVGVAALYRGLASGMMSIVAPIANIAPVVPLAVGVALGEVPGPIQVAGLVLVVVGIVLTSYQPRAGGATGPRRRASVVYGLLSALGFGIFFTAMDGASEGAIPWGLLVARSSAVAAIAAVGVVLVAVKRSRLAVRARDLPVLALIGGLIVASDSMYAVASTVGLLGVVAVLSALHPVVTVGLARVYLHEPIERIQYLGIAICMCGVVAITAG